MNWKTVEQIAKNPGMQMYYSQKEISIMLGYGRARTSQFLQENSVPYYRIGNEKRYFLPEVLEAVEKTRWME